VSPARINARLFSHKGELHMYGGCPTEVELLEDLDAVLEPFFSNEEGFMMRLDKNTHQWKSVTYTGAPADIWDNRHYRSAGVQNTFEQIGYSVLAFWSLHRASTDACCANPNSQAAALIDTACVSITSGAPFHLPAGRLPNACCRFIQTHLMTAAYNMQVFCTKTTFTWWGASLILT